MADHQEYVDLALELISADGRQVTYFSADQTSSDGTQPWDGPTNVKAGAGTVLWSLFLTPNQVRIFNLPALGLGTEYDDLVRFSEQIIVIAPEGNDVKQFSIVEDSDGSNWKITAVQQFKPADKLILAYAGVRR